MKFAYLWLLYLIPLYILLEIYLFFRRKKTFAETATGGWIQAKKTWRTILIQISTFLPPVVVILVLLALAEPQKKEIQEYLLPSGIDIMIALDVSGSMAAEDFQPQNRLEVAKSVLKDFIRGRPSDRIGLILFSGSSVTRVPLTHQHETVVSTLEKTRLGSLPDGTAIGWAIMTGVQRLRPTGKPATEKGSRILVLITDGRNNAGEIHPRDAIKYAIENQIKVYTIGVGSHGEVPFPVFSPRGEKSYRYERVDLDEELLKEIAEQTGGRYYRAVDPRSLQQLFAEINRLEKSDPIRTQNTFLLSRRNILVIPALVFLLSYWTITTFIVRFP